jgi:hypothetical protein
MPLIIGELNARIEVEESSAPGPAAAAPDPLEEEARRMRALAAARFEAERRIEQRDPDNLGRD